METITMPFDDYKLAHQEKMNVSYRDALREILCELEIYDCSLVNHKKSNEENLKKVAEKIKNEHGKFIGKT